MRHTLPLVISGVLLSSIACSKSSAPLPAESVAARQSAAEAPLPGPASAPAPRGAEDALAASGSPGTLGSSEATTAGSILGANAVDTNGDLKTVSLTDSASADTAAQAYDRKIIRNADISMESDDPAAIQRKVATIAEQNSGFVVTSDSAATGESASVSLTARVPALQFGKAVEGIRAAGGKILHEKITGQDVTEEYIDLDARIRVKQELEAKFTEILKQARSISEAMQVQSQIAGVRTEIEQLEGRRRFLANQSSLSTITVAIKTPAPAVPILASATPGGFVSDLRQALGDSLEMSLFIVLGLIRFVGLAVPIVLFVCLPIYAVGRLVLSRRARTPVATQS